MPNAEPSTPQASLFRKAALAKIQSPEQLDTLLPITSPLSWLALLMVGFALAVTVIWAFTGTIMRTTTGQGIIVRDGQRGITSIGGQGSGAILDILIQPGDEVLKGQPIFNLDLALLRAQLESSKKTLEALLEQAEMEDDDEGDRLTILREKLTNQEDLYRRGLLTKSPVLETMTAIYDVQGRQYARNQQILDQQSKIKDLETRLHYEGIVRAPYSGEVLEVDVNIGDFAQPGRVLARLQSLDGDYEAIVFVPAGEGKKVKKGMTIRVSPSTVRPEEFGYIQGKVKSVSLYPISKEDMMTELGNEIMVDRLLQSGEVIALIATLEMDPATPSGFRWSSSRGPNTMIEGGTLCQASVVLERQRPVTLLIPFLKKQLGMY